MNEQIPGPKKEPTHHGEEDILEHLHRCTQGRATCTDEDARAIHQDYEGCESFEMYQAYRQKTLPSLTQIDTSIEALVARIPRSLLEDAECARVSKLLKGRPLVIRQAVRSYAESVIRFVRIRLSGESIRDPEAFVKVDHERRRRHENLLRVLSETLAMFVMAEDLGLCTVQDFHEWNIGDDSIIPHGRVPLFSKAAISNRDLIKNWALAADFAEEYSKLTSIIGAK